MIAALVLAAGRSSRAPSNKLLAEKNGRAMIAHCIDAVRNSQVDQIIIITGHDGNRIRAALRDDTQYVRYDVQYVHNPDYASGMASSIASGVRAVQNADENADGVLICLADMPDITSEHINQIIQDGADKICFPIKGEVQGHPVLWPKRFFVDLLKLSGDQGAKSLLQKHLKDSHAVQMRDNACFTDCDTDEAVKKWNQ